MHEISHTQFFKVEKAIRPNADEILKTVHYALMEQGYDPVQQIVGYVMSGDPTYITSYENARSLIMKVERDEIIEELIRSYIKNELKQG